MKMYLWEYAGVTDHCMELKEKAGGDPNLFTVEKRLRRLRKKHEQCSEQQCEREKREMNVFDFINSKLGGKRGLQHVHSCFIHTVHQYELFHSIYVRRWQNMCILWLYRHARIFFMANTLAANLDSCMQGQWYPFEWANENYMLYNTKVLRIFR
jgi:hypothetical protein